MTTDSSEHTQRSAASALDLPLAWRRVKSDIDHRVFIGHPYAVSVIEHGLESWIAARSDELQGGRYDPKPMFVCDVPKGGGLIRPGAHLSYADRLVYTACVGACLPAIHEVLGWAQGSVDFSYQLASDSKNPDWIRNRFGGWRDFDQTSLNYIRDQTEFVVFADITAFYENIDIGLLISDLKATGAPQFAIAQLSTCLNKWSQIPGRGLPQGQTPSDILAKLYVNNIDRRLTKQRYRYVRYVDDMRAFFSTLREAKQFLVDISRLLRKRGLCVQSAKARIVTAEDARGEIENVTRVLKNVCDEFIAEVVEVAGFGDPYLEIAETDALLESSPDETPIEVIERAYQVHVIESPEQFNKTLFYFLLNRLGKQKNDFALSHVLEMLEPHPEETQEILKYLAAVDLYEVVEPIIVDALQSGQLIYDYQTYQIMSWFLIHLANPSEELMDFARGIGFELRCPRYLRTVCRALLGKFGSQADLERIAEAYDETPDPSERVEIICSLVRLEVGRRNSFLARAARDGEANDRAVRWIKSVKI
jgi:hypothetical protein